MKLLIDLGNSRLKSALWDGAQLSHRPMLAHAAEARVVVVLTKADRHDAPDAAVARVQTHVSGLLPVVAIDARSRAVADRYHRDH